MTILITCDLDSSLCDTGHRQHMIDRTPGGVGTDWNAYSLACGNDAPVVGVVRVLQLLALNPDIVIVGLSARMATAEQITLDWMKRHEVPIDRVFLDPGIASDYHAGYTHADYKLARLRQVEEAMGLPVSLHIDDYAEVADTFNNAGVPTIALRTPQEISEILASDHLMVVSK